VLPLAGAAIPDAGVTLRPVAEAARMGLVLAEEDAAHNAAMLGWSPTVLVSNAPGAEAAARAARRLVARERIGVLVGGYTREEAETLGDVAEEAGILFLNVGAASDALRTGACRPRTFHVEASAAMYLDAIAGWFVRAGFRRWYLVTAEGPEGAALAERVTRTITARHWGAQKAGESVVRPGRLDDLDAAVRDIAREDPELVLLLTDWRSQLDVLSRYESAGLARAVTGFSTPVTQTRRFLYASRQAAPRAGSGYRAALWEATLDAYGARELNARFAGRWGQPMDPPAWSAYQAVKIAFEAALACGSSDGADLAHHLLADDVVFDVHKGIGVSFRPWDHQLRQTLYLVKINPDASPSLTLDALTRRASLVGELPAIYMPGTDPIERLDQIGDIGRTGTCA
jgi:ABC transporter substrate binding protein (PQQ-dependent alcohol dehydrogenase system)